MLELGLWRSELGRGLGMAVQRQTGVGVVLESSTTTAGGVCGGSLGHHRGQSPLFGGCTRGGVGPRLQPSSLWACMQRAGHCLHGLQGQSQASTAAHLNTRSSHQPPLLLSHKPGVVMGSCHLPPRPQE